MIEPIICPICEAVDTHFEWCTEADTGDGCEN